MIKICYVFFFKKLLNKRNFSRRSSSIFEKDGNVSKNLQGILQILHAVKINHNKTQTAINLLEKNQIISNWDLNIKFKDADKKIEGLYQINEDKIKTLKAETLFNLNKCGALEIAFSQIISKQQLGRLANLHVKAGNVEQPSKSMREIAIEKQTMDKKKNLMIWFIIYLTQNKTKTFFKKFYDFVELFINWYFICKFKIKSISFN